MAASGPGLSKLQRGGGGWPALRHLPSLAIGLEADIEPLRGVSGNLRRIPLTAPPSAIDVQDRRQVVGAARHREGDRRSRNREGDHPPRPLPAEAHQTWAAATAPPDHGAGDGAFTDRLNLPDGPVELI
jgi:hypothetical protein